MNIFKLNLVLLLTLASLSMYCCLDPSPMMPASVPSQNIPQAQATENDKTSKKIPKEIAAVNEKLENLEVYCPMNDEECKDLLNNVKSAKKLVNEKDDDNLQIYSKKIEAFYKMKDYLKKKAALEAGIIETIAGIDRKLNNPSTMASTRLKLTEYRERLNGVLRKSNLRKEAELISVKELLESRSERNYFEPELPRRSHQSWKQADDSEYERIKKIIVEQQQIEARNLLDILIKDDEQLKKLAKKLKDIDSEESDSYDYLFG